MVRMEEEKRMEEKEGLQRGWKGIRYFQGSLMNLQQRRVKLEDLLHFSGTLSLQSEKILSHFEGPMFVVPIMK